MVTNREFAGDAVTAFGSVTLRGAGARLVLDWAGVPEPEAAADLFVGHHGTVTYEVLRGTRVVVAPNDGGVLQIESAGTDEQLCAWLLVSDAATPAGTLGLRFIDGFAPRQGERFNLLSVCGGLTGSFDAVQCGRCRGLRPTAQAWRRGPRRLRRCSRRIAAGDSMLAGVSPKVGGTAPTLGSHGGESCDCWWSRTTLYFERR